MADMTADNRDPSCSRTSSVWRGRAEGPGVHTGIGAEVLHDADQVLVGGSHRPPQLLQPTGIRDPGLLAAIDVDVLDQLVVQQFLKLTRAVDRAEDRGPKPISNAGSAGNSSRRTSMSCRCWDTTWRMMLCACCCSSVAMRTAWPAACRWRRSASCASATFPCSLRISA